MLVLPDSTISLNLSSASISLGNALTLSGTITQTQPSQGISTGTTVMLSLSSDGCTTWNLLLTTSTSGGSYSTSWTPPYPGSYTLQASWSGNANYAGSASSPASLAVTGTAAPSSTLLLSAPLTASSGQTIRMSITVFNPTPSFLNANVMIQITGPGGYVAFDVIQVNVAANSQSTAYSDWAVPNQVGAYTVTVLMMPSSHPITSPDIAAIDTATIQIS